MAPGSATRCDGSWPTGFAGVRRLPQPPAYELGVAAGFHVCQQCHEVGHRRRFCPASPPLTGQLELLPDAKHPDRKTKYWAVDGRFVHQGVDVINAARATVGSKVAYRPLGGNAAAVLRALES